MTQFFGFEKTISDNKDTKDGSTVTSRVALTQTYRMPDKLLLRETKDSYTLQPLGNGFSGSGLKLTSSDIRACEWDGSVYGPNGPLNQPKQRSEVTRSYGYKSLTTIVDEKGASVPGPPVWTQIAESRTGFSYDTFSGK